MLEIVQNFIQTNIPIARSIRVTDILDISILSFFIYKLLWTFRKSSSGGVMRGVGVLLFAVWLAARLSLTATSFVLNKAVEWGILAIVILFQPELRRLLERMGSSTGWFGDIISSNRTSPAVLEDAIAETTDAYASMSKDKVGALMVFERRNLLDDVIKTGTELDCAVNSELLKNIFWNKAPLHDGAVIVREGRIVGAGCMLPLSGNVNLSRDLGMRHRAGIGISEHSDAVVVIVSEETGSISAAVDGMLKRHLAPETLERLLRNELLHDEENDRSTKRNTQIPVLSQLFAFVKREEDEQ